MTWMPRAMLMMLGCVLTARDARALEADAAEARLRGSVLRSFEEARRSGHAAVMCPSDDGRRCLRVPDWSQGWIAFVDADLDREHSPGEPLIDAWPALPGQVRVRSTLGRTRLVFGRHGAPASAAFTLCDERGAAHARALVLADGGQLRRTAPAAVSSAATCRQ